MRLTGKEKSARFRAAHPEYYKDRVAALRADYFKDKSCCWCGAVDSLEIDHVDPALKVSHRIFTWAPARRAEELAKCRVLCNACHRKRTTKQMSKPRKHGTLTEYTSYHCRCDECRRAMRDYYRANPRDPSKVGSRKGPKHGTLNWYRRHKCRCRPCIDAALESQRQWEKKRYAAVRAQVPLSDTASCTETPKL